jgi:hypothetical protein
MNLRESNESWHWCVTVRMPWFMSRVLNTTFRKLDLFPSSGVAREASTLFCPIGTDCVFLKDRTEWMSPSPHLKTETDPVSERLCSTVLRIPDDGQSPEPQWF